MVDKPLTRAEIDLNAYAHNIKELRRITNPDARIMAVVKANGYGHGAAEVAREAMQNGATWLPESTRPLNYAKPVWKHRF